MEGVKGEDEAKEVSGRGVGRADEGTAEAEAGEEGEEGIGRRWGRHRVGGNVDQIAGQLAMKEQI